MGVETADATCLANSLESNTFNTYITKCRTQADNTRSTHFFSESLNEIKDSFAQQRSHFDNLIHTGNSLHTLGSLSQNTKGGVDTRIRDLTEETKTLNTKLQKYRTISSSSDKSFLEDIMNGKTPQKELTPSLQDVTLLLFWFGWTFIIITLTAVRWFSPQGTWKEGLSTLFLLLLITFCLYSILVYIA
jgi:hypothetical protein